MTVEPQSEKLGYVGRPSHINVTALELLLQQGFIPVISPICGGANSHAYNVNADLVAGAIAGALNAERLIMMTDISGLLDENKQLIAEIRPSRVQQLIESGTISGGMLPKVGACLDALEKGVHGVVILNGKNPNSLITEAFTDRGAGTLFLPDEAASPTHQVQTLLERRQPKIQINSIN